MMTIVLILGGWFALSFIFCAVWAWLRQERRHRPISEHTAEHWQ